jgi:hypothetical protein
MGAIYYNATVTVIWLGRGELRQVLQAEEQIEGGAESAIIKTLWNSRVWTLQASALSPLVLIPDYKAV